MRIVKPNNFKKSEIFSLVFIYLILILNALFFKDSAVAFVSAFFGITYTIFAGKGLPICYLFGVTGSGFYSYLAFHNALWGNLILYMGYYIPMQILGFLRWQKHLKAESAEIVKIKLSAKEFLIILAVTLIICVLTIAVLFYMKDKSPFIDGITTVLSLAGMYLTVRRAIEQWIFWMVVNGLSAIMWINIALSGEKVYSTVIMWCVYFVLAIYFYINWKKDLKE